MTVDKSTSDPSTRLRSRQLSLRGLLLLFPVVALLTAFFMSFEHIPYEEFTRGDDHIISTSRFEIVVKGAGDGSSGSGTLPVGGMFGGAGRGVCLADGVVVYEESYSLWWGTLRYEINGAQFSFRKHAREVVANGQRHPIRYRAIVTIDEQNNISVKDRPQD